MKFNTYCIPMLLLCVLLANEVRQTASGDVGTEFAMGSLPIISGMVAMTMSGPLVPVLVATIGVMQLSTRILTADDSSGGALSKNDFLESQSKIADAVKNIDTHVLESHAKLTDSVESYAKLEDMRNDLDTLREAYADNMKIILNPKITGIPKKTSMRAMLDYFSTFRQTLRSFCSKYIIPKGVMPTTGDVNLFFDFILRKHQLAADSGDDCYLESTHTKLFKSFMYILKILTDAYVMAISAHTMQYQKELRAGNDNEAIETQKIGLKLLDQYKIDMKAFMDKTKLSLDKASREIRNCGTFELKRGETYESISFAHILPKLKDWNFDPNEHYSIYSGPTFKCFTREQDVKYRDYEIIDNKCTDGGLNKPAKVTIFVNSTTSEWPYKYLKNDPSIGANKVLGRSKNQPGLISREVFATRSCYPLFCPAYKKNAVAISTQIVRAKPGNVITGVRFRVRNKVIRIDIQEGKMLDDLSVDPKTVTWTETPESDEVLYLNANARKIELGAAEVKENTYLTSIQLKMINEADGIIGVIAGGAMAPNWTPTALSGSSHLDKSNELVLSECDNPEELGANVKNMISKPPVPSEHFYVSFQHSDLNKNLGSTTIPFIDIREVVSNPPAPLGGLGIMHQAIQGSGGYISLKLIASSLTHFIDYNIIGAIDTTVKH